MKDLESFCSRPKQECSISIFDPDAVQNHGSLVIKTAIVRKSHLRCFVNKNLAFVLVDQERNRGVCQNHIGKGTLVVKLMQHKSFLHF